MEHNKVFRTLAAGRVLPPGWGFPLAAGEQVPGVTESDNNKRARAALFPLQTMEEQAQLVRFYFGCVMAFPYVYRSFNSSGEAYCPGSVYKPFVESEAFKPVMLPGRGWTLSDFRWTGGPLFGTLSYGDPLTLVFTAGGKDHDMTVINTGISDIHEVKWPEHVALSCGIKFEEGFGMEAGLQSWVAFRPHGFDARLLVERGAKFLLIDPDFISSGILSSFMGSVTNEEKLALMWLYLFSSAQ